MRILSFLSRCSLSLLFFPMAHWPVQAQTLPQSQIAGKDFKQRDLKNIRAVRQNTSAVQDHVLHYNPSTLSIEQFERDLPVLKPFIHLTTLRLVLSTKQWNAQWTAFRPLVLAMQKAGYQVEIVFEISSQGLSPAIVESLKSLHLSAVSLKAPREQHTWSLFLDTYRQFQDAFGNNHNKKEQTKVGLWFEHLPTLMRLKSASLHAHLPLPDFYLYHFQGPLYDLHTHILRLNHHLQAPWQLAQFSPTGVFTSHHREHEEAWYYRFLFYFSKKYALLPAAVALYPSGRTPSILRSAVNDTSVKRTPAYWLSHIYFHLNRIDIDEYKLTRALYTPIAGDKALRPNTEKFLKVYYKLLSDAHLPDYVAHKRSDLFYDFIKREAEESLLNSHFARLQTVLPSAKSGPSVFSLNFLSALGDFRFLQSLRYGAEIVGLNPPLLASDFRVYEKVSAAHLPWTLQLKKTLVDYPQLDLDWSLLKPLNGSQGKVFPQALFLKIHASEQGFTYPVDIQPLALEENKTGHVFIPDPLFFKFFKRLEPQIFKSQVAIQALLPFPDSDHGFELHVSAEPAREKSPRRLDAHVDVVKQNLGSTTQEIRLVLKNPFVERLFLPGLVIIAEQESRVFVLEYVMPEGLLPLEQREYTLHLPPEFQQQIPMKWSVQGAAYPVVDREINLDDAFRSEVFDLKPQALEKYTEVFSRFASQLSQEHRLSVIESILYLSTQLESVAQTEQRFMHLMAWVNAPQQGYTGQEQGLTPRSKAVLALGLVRAYLQQGAPSPRLLSLLQQHLDRVFAEKKVTFTLEDYKLWGYVQKLTGSQEALNTYHQALSLALAQQNTSEINFLYERLLDMSQAQGAYARASQWLLSWRNHPAYALLPLKEQQQHLKRLGYLAERQSDPQAAIRYYRLYLQTAGDTEAQLHLAQLYQKQKQKGEAIQSYKRYLKDCQSCDSRVYKELGFLLEASSPREAIGYYTRYLQKNPADGFAVKNTVVNLHLKQGTLLDLRQADVLNRQLLKACGSQCALYWERQGGILMKLGQKSQALSAYDQALQKKFSRSLLKTVAYLAVEQNQVALATQRLKQWLPLARGTEQAQLRLTLGELYRVQGQSAQLKSLLQPFLAGRLALPRDPQSAIAVAQLYQSIGALEPAISILEKATQSATALPYQYRLLSALHRERGNLEQATLWLERLKSRFPQENTLPLFKAYQLRKPEPRRRLLPPR